MFKPLDLLEFLNFFEADPVEYDEREGFVSYCISDGSEMLLRFSCHAIEGSVQVVLEFRGHEVVMISGESVVSVQVKEDYSGQYIFVDFEIHGLKSQAKVWVKPYIKVQWFTLRE